MPMLGGAQVDYLVEVRTLNSGNILINLLTISNNEAAIVVLEADIAALQSANLGLLANNVTISEIILNLIIPDPSQIGYLTQVSAANTALITANNGIIASKNTLISGLNGVNSTLAAENATLTADNSLIDAIILQVTPN